MPEVRDLLSDGRIHFGARSDVSLAHDCVRRSRRTRIRAWKNEMGNEQLEAGNIAGERTCWRIRRVRLIGQNETIAGAMYSPRLVKEVLKALGKQLVDDGRLDSVSRLS